MRCGVYNNGYGFKVGRKYIYLTEAYTNDILEKKVITNPIRAELDRIKKKYRPDDINRTIGVVNLFEIF